MTLRPRQHYEHSRFRILRGNPKTIEQRVAFIERELHWHRKPIGALVLGGPHDLDCRCFVCERKAETSRQMLDELIALLQAKKEEVMPVRAKFKVDSIEVINQPKSVKQDDGSYKTEPGAVTTLKLSPVFSNGDPNHENSKFWAASPGGSLALNCVNPAAVQQFEVGKEYYVDFTPAG